MPEAARAQAGFSMGAMQAAKLLAELGTGERRLGARSSRLCVGWG